MKNTTLISILSIIFPAILLNFSCSKQNPDQVPVIPKPTITEYNKCATDGEVYKLLFDTLIVNSKREMYTVDTLQIKYKLDNAMPLGVCEKTADLYGSAKYSPLSATVKTDEMISRDMKWDRQGYFRDIILESDIDRILKFTDGKSVTFYLSLLNYNKDIIQTSPIALIYRDKFPVK